MSSPAPLTTAGVPTNALALALAATAAATSAAVLEAALAEVVCILILI